MGVLMLILLTSFASAAVNFVNTANSVSSVNQGNSVTVSFSIQESGLGNVTNISFNTPITLTSSSSSFHSENTVIGAVTVLNKNETSGVMALTFNVPSSQATGVYSGSLGITGSSSTGAITQNLPITLTVTGSSSNTLSDFCTYQNSGVNDNIGDLSVDIKNVEVDNGFGDGKKWYPFDEISFDVKVSNNGNEDVNSISLEWGLYDNDNGKWVIKPTEEDNFDLSNGDDQTTTVNFKLDDSMDEDLSDLSNGDHYVLYARATGEVDNSNNQKTCLSDSNDINIIIDRNFVITKNLVFPATISCGTNLEVKGDVWNIGSKDQKDLTVKIFNNELGISQTVDFAKITSFSSKKLDVNLPIPENATEKTYSISFEVYDSNGDIYSSTKTDQDSTSTIAAKIQGGCSTSSGTTAQALVSANLQSGGDAGKPLVISATIKNTGSSKATFLLNAAGYSDWADSATLDKTSVTLNPGDSTQFLLTLNVKSAASGDQLFNIEVDSGNDVVLMQPVSVSIKSSQFSFSSAFGSNWYLWFLGLFNLILIVVIIIIAVRVSRKK